MNFRIVPKQEKSTVSEIKDYSDKKKNDDELKRWKLVTGFCDYLWENNWPVDDWLFDYSNSIARIRIRISYWWKGKKRNIPDWNVGWRAKSVRA